MHIRWPLNSNVFVDGLLIYGVSLNMLSGFIIILTITIKKSEYFLVYRACESYP